MMEENNRLFFFNQQTHRLVTAGLETDAECSPKITNPPFVTSPMI